MNATGEAWQLYICRACGLIYDEEKGDPDSGLPPGTRFTDIPDDWECPLCGVGKSDFELFDKPVIEENAASFSNKNRRATGLIIVGAGTAGWSAVEAIRQHDSQTPITMITACSGHRYHKPELSLAIGRELDEEKLINETGSDAAARLGINLLANTFVVGLSAKTKSIRTTRGSFRFTKLVLAQGAQSAIPNGVPADFCWRINHLSAWQGLKENLSKKAQTIAIIGAGMVGCELAENLSAAGHKVKLIYRGDAPLSQLLPREVGLRLANLFSGQGIECLANTSVTNTERLTSEGSSDFDLNRYKIYLSNEKTVTADQIITATGLKIDERIPNLAGLLCDNGILVDPQTLQTSQQEIFALGDCVSFEGESCRFISPIVEQAKVIAAQIRGDQHIVYAHSTPNIRLKVQSCKLIVEGQPNNTLPWKLVKEDKRNLCLEQRQQDQRISRVELTQVV